MGQMCVEEKTNEIPTVLLLLDFLDISGYTAIPDRLMEVLLYRMGEVFLPLLNRCLLN